MDFVIDVPLADRIAQYKDNITPYCTSIGDRPERYVLKENCDGLLAGWTVLRDLSSNWSFAMTRAEKVRLYYVDEILHWLFAEHHLFVSMYPSEDTHYKFRIYCSGKPVINKIYGNIYGYNNFSDLYIQAIYECLDYVESKRNH